MRSGGVFIAGTDTDVGKTIVTGLLAAFLSRNGIKTVTQKWVQTGAGDHEDDVTRHLGIMGIGTEQRDRYLPDIVPYSFSFPSSPHLASAMENISVSPDLIKRAFMRLSGEFDIVLAEGSGGVMVPLNDSTFMVDIVKDLELPVILVVENRLGAINHAMLSLEALDGRGIPVIGTIFNRPRRTGDSIIFKDNMNIIGKMSGCPVLGEIPYEEDMDSLNEAFSPIGSGILDLSGWAGEERTGKIRSEKG